MAKQKKNPNKIPISLKDVDIDKIKTESTEQIILQEWAVVLAALSTFPNITTERILDFWNYANKTPTKVNSLFDVQRILPQFYKIAGVSLAVKNTNPNIHTVGDLERFKRQVKTNAIATAFTIILEPILAGEFLSEEERRIVIQKSAAMNEEIEDGEITISDIQEMLAEEYGLKLEISDNRTILYPIL